MSASDELRSEVRAWLAAHWDAERPEADFIVDVVDAGWAAPSFPVEFWGRGLPPALAAVVAEEFQRVGAPGGGQGGAGRAANPLLGNTILNHGSNDLRRRFLRPLLLGEIVTCLLYSEPGAGSDLAAVQTRADRDGEEWVVNGQKVWTTLAHEADYGMLVARTNWDAPKHKGLSFFVFPLHQEGVEVHPIKQITGDTEFNEVFFSDALVPDANRIGAVNDGWRVLQTALAAERLIMGAGRRSRQRAGADSDASTVEGGADFVALTRQRGRAGEPLVRQAVARLYTSRRVNRWNAQRAQAAMLVGTSSPLASLGKLAMSDILHSSAALNSKLLGAEGMLLAPESAVADSVNRASMTAFVNSIGGGSDQIQRNIIGERVLGLPREPDIDRDLPFRQVRKAEGIRRFG
jgi:alkylation response protein AidB-like acyl-CoA dehydrogenase